MNSELQLPKTAEMHREKKGDFIYFDDGVIYNKSEVHLLKKIKTKQPKEDLLNLVHKLKKELGVFLVEVH